MDLQGIVKVCVSIFRDMFGGRRGTWIPATHLTPKCFVLMFGHGGKQDVVSGGLNAGPTDGESDRLRAPMTYYPF